MLRRVGCVVFVVSVVVLAAACTQPPASPPASTTTTTVVDPNPQTPVGDDQIRLNQIQEVGTHNSYHVAPDPSILSLLEAAASAFPGISKSLGDPSLLDYTHAPIPDQLAAGIRTFEFDIWADPTGGRFDNPKLPANFGFKDPQLPAGLDVPGFKVFHIVDVDYRTRCVSLQVCLGLLRTWSDAHPDHLPVMIDIEMKEDALPAPFVGTPVLPFDATELDAVDAELVEALGNRILTPDEVRGDAPTLNQAITTTGWPTLAASRGKFLFYMDNEDTRAAYIAGHPNLEGREMFTSSTTGQPDSAVVKMNDPADGTAIAELVRQGYIVRTRADDGVVRASQVNTAVRDTALASGAQIVSTDYPPNEPLAGSGYVVTFGTRVAGRCNPVTTTGTTCSPLAVVEPN